MWNVSNRALARDDARARANMTRLQAACCGVGVKFGPLLGEAVAKHVLGFEQMPGVNVFEASDDMADLDDDQLEDRAW